MSGCESEGANEPFVCAYMCMSSYFLYFMAVCLLLSMSYFTYALII